jgi:hypothetical protein
MMKMDKSFFKKTVCNSRGFSLLEVLLGITVFMIGMLGVTALNISSLKSSTFAGNMSEAVIIAGDRLEALMALPFDDADLNDSPSPYDDGTNEDLLPAGPPPGDGIDDDGGNFGLDDTGTGAGEADHWELGVGKNGMFTRYWNVAIGEPLPDKTKTVNVIVEWDIKGKIRRMNMSTIILDHD